MTVAKPQLRQARRLLLKHLDVHPGRVVDNDLDPLEAGLNGGPDHVDTGTSYHLGKDQLKMSKKPYSVVESRRDRDGLDNHSSAMDIGEFKIKTSEGTFDLRHFSRWLVDLCEAADQDTADIREVIYSLDGKKVKRWDRLRKRVSGHRSHRTHTHISIHRDADGSCMVRLATQYLQLIGRLAREDDEMKLILARELGDPKVYVGNGVTRRHVRSREDLENLQFWLTQRRGYSAEEAKVHDFNPGTLAAVLGVLVEEPATAPPG